MKTVISFIIVIIQAFIQWVISGELFDIGDYIDFTINASYIIGAVVVPVIFIFLLYKIKDTVAVSEDDGKLYRTYLARSTIISLVASVILHWFTEEDINKITFAFSSTFSILFAIAWFNVLAYFGRIISINLQYYSYHGTTRK